MGSFVSCRPRSGRASLLTAAAVLAAGSVASASPVLTVPFADGKVLNVNAVVGTGSSSAYLAVDFSNGTSEAFQYNYTGPLNGYGLLTAVEAATTLKDQDTYYPSFGEHLISYVTDGANTTAQYPSLYYAPPNVGDTVAGTSSQGVAYVYSTSGADNLVVHGGEVVAFDNSSSALPVLPETSPVPEPTLLAAASLVVPCLTRRRRRRA